MSERLPRDLTERIEVDIDPFIESEETRDDTEWLLSDFTRRANVELGRRGIYLALRMQGAAVDVDAEAQAASRPTDEDLINEAIERAQREGALITDAAARVIASQLHGGQETDLYAFASSGAIQEDLLVELQGIRRDETLDDTARSWTKPLRRYIKARTREGATDRVPGWVGLWLAEQPIEVEDEWERQQEQTIADLQADIRRRELDNEHDRNVIARLRRNIEMVRRGIKPSVEPLGADLRLAVITEMDRLASTVSPERSEQEPIVPDFKRARAAAARREQIEAKARELVMREYGPSNQHEGGDSE